MLDNPLLAYDRASFRDALLDLVLESADPTRLLLSAQGAAGPHRHSSPAVFTYDVTSESR